MLNIYKSIWNEIIWDIHFSVKFSDKASSVFTQCLHGHFEL